MQALGPAEQSMQHAEAIVDATPADLGSNADSTSDGLSKLRARPKELTISIRVIRIRTFTASVAARAHGTVTGRAVPGCTDGTYIKGVPVAAHIAQGINAANGAPQDKCILMCWRGSLHDRAEQIFWA